MTWDEFVAAVEREEATLTDEAAGHVYDLGKAILRELHNRVAALEEHTGLTVPCPSTTP